MVRSFGLGGSSSRWPVERLFPGTGSMIKICIRWYTWLLVLMQRQQESNVAYYVVVEELKLGIETLTTAGQ
jgi:hypothetical protein